MARIIDGRAVAEKMRAEMKEEVVTLKKKYDLTPSLAVVLVGEDPASQVYVRNKQKACDKLGIRSEEYRFPKDYEESKLLDLIDKFNKNPEIHGILVQLPLPEHINQEKVLNKIDPSKDVDGFHPINVGRLMVGKPLFLPCTPHGIQQLLLRSGIQIEGKHVVVVGRSNIVGKPVAMILVQKQKGANATVTICHTGTKDMAHYTRDADILIVAAGRPNTVTADMVKEGAVVIDVGVNRVEDPSAKRGYRLVGDVDFENVSRKAAAISPVPGGVGPMTITMLLYNTINAAKMIRGIA